MNKKKIIIILVIIVIGILVINGFDPINFVKSLNSKKGEFIKVGKMSIPRSQHEAILLDDGTVLILGGQTKRWGYERTTNSAEIYNPKTKRFKRVGDMQDRIEDYTATKLNNGKVLIAGGKKGNNTTGNWERLKKTQIYNPLTKTFIKGPNMNYPRQDHTATLLGDGRVLIAGGEYNANSEAEIYNPKTNKFELAAKMNIPRFKHSAILLNDGRVLITCGVGSAPKFDLLSSVEIYDLKTDKFELVGDMNIARRNSNVYLLKNGNVLISGGLQEGLDDNKVFRREIEIYDPTTDNFNVIAKRSSPAVLPAEVLLQDDKLLFSGGCTGVGLSLTYSKSSEIFNPITKEFVKGKDMNRFRSAHKMTLLKDGNVLISGTEGSGRTAELYINK